MAITSSYPISLSNVAAEFGDSAPYSLTDYYKDGSGKIKTYLVTGASSVPASGNISLGDFLGVAIQPVSGTISPSSSSITQGAALSFSVSSLAGGKGSGYTYSWSFTGAGANPSTSFSSNPSVSTSSTGSVVANCTVTSGVVSTALSSASVAVGQAFPAAGTFSHWGNDTTVTITAQSATTTTVTPSSGTITGWQDSYTSAVTATRQWRFNHDGAGGTVMTGITQDINSTGGTPVTATYSVGTWSAGGNTGASSTPSGGLLTFLAAFGVNVITWKISGGKFIAGRTLEIQAVSTGNGGMSVAGNTSLSNTRVSSYHTVATTNSSISMNTMLTTAGSYPSAPRPILFNTGTLSGNITLRVVDTTTGRQLGSTFTASY